MEVTNPFLTDPDNAKAYQHLCDQPRGSSRAWAKQTGWTHSKMVRFIEALKAEGLCRIEPRRGGSLFVPICATVPKRSETFRNADVLDTKSNSKPPVSRYGEAPGTKQQPIAELDELRLIAAANEVLFQRKWTAISLDNFGSLKAAKKMLAVVPCDRAIPLLEQAVRLFNPSATDGEPLRSLGHPFITRYVINEFRRTERDLAQGQLSMFFVERTSPPQHVVGSKVLPTEAEPALVSPEEISAARAEIERLRPAKG